jgi:hypothetical protein
MDVSCALKSFITIIQRNRSIIALLLHVAQLYITSSLFKGLFGYPEESKFSMDEYYVDDIPKFSMRIFFTSYYTEEKVKKAVFQMEHNKMPCPNGLLAEFY